MSVELASTKQQLEEKVQLVQEQVYSQPHVTRPNSFSRRFATGGTAA